MNIKLNPEISLGLSYFIARFILGISFFNAAIWKIFVLSPTQHTQQFFLIPFQATWIPEPLLWLLGMTIPFIELGIGILLCLGYRSRETAFLTGLLLILTTYGHSLLEPLYNISQGLTMARVALVLFLLAIPNKNDIFSIEYVFDYFVKKLDTM